MPPFHRILATGGICLAAVAFARAVNKVYPYYKQLDM